MPPLRICHLDGVHPADPRREVSQFLRALFFAHRGDDCILHARGHVQYKGSGTDSLLDFGSPRKTTRTRKTKAAECYDSPLSAKLSILAAIARDLAEMYTH